MVGSIVRDLVPMPVQFRAISSPEPVGPRDVSVMAEGRKRGWAHQMPDKEDDAERWRMLANEARSTASEMTDPEARRALLFIAAAYERLARGAQTRKDQRN